MADYWIESAAFWGRFEADAWFPWTRKRYRKEADHCRNEARECFEYSACWTLTAEAAEWLDAS